MRPLWNKQTFDQVGIRPEARISPDGTNWSRWYSLPEIADEIQPFYPDGSPNRHFGFVYGKRISTDLNLFSRIAYRFIFSRENTSAPSPVLKEVRLFHADVTVGEGKLAAEFPLEAEP